jgi:hypothetical protein
MVIQAGVLTCKLDFGRLKPKQQQQLVLVLVLVMVMVMEVVV